MDTSAESQRAFQQDAPPIGRIPNRGAFISAYGLAGACALAAHAGTLGEPGARVMFGIIHSLQALCWCGSLAAFLIRPSLNRRTPYSRYASAVGAAALGFAYAYGAAAAWTGFEFAVWAAFVVAGLALARLPRGARGWSALLAGAALSGLTVYARGPDALRSDAAALLAPLALGEAVALFVDRVRSEGELSVKNLRNRNEELEELAYKDPLTRLYNRRFAFESLHREVSFARRYSGELHILVLDIDHFKRVNDELGHPTGDSVLAELGRILESSVRESDIAARIGGEEFLVILPLSRAEHVQGVANRIRDITARTVFTAVPWRVTVSVGVTALRAEDDAESMFSRADRFLYDSKRGGRNRVTGS